MIKDYDVVRLKRAYPEYGVAAGADGTVLMTFDKPPGYLIEVSGTEGVTVTASPDEVELLISVPE
jgi:hypothetical protein